MAKKGIRAQQPGAGEINLSRPGDLHGFRFLGGATMSEPDSRLRFLAAIVSDRGAKHEEMQSLHADVEQCDPQFYAQAAAWYCDHGAASAHREIFLARLILCACASRRAFGLALLRRLPPRQVAGIVDYIHGRKTTRRVSVPAKSTLASRLTRWMKPQSPPQTELQLRTESFGLFRNPPRSLRSEIARYLREREADAAQFDQCVMDSPNAMKRLYALNHIKPGERAQRILFDRNPPPDSCLFARRQLAKARMPAEQLRLIADLAIPYSVAASVLIPMNPAVLCALVEKMTPDELIRQLPSLKRHRVLENAYLKGRIDRKLEKFPPAALAVAPEPNNRSANSGLEEIERYPIPISERADL
jgi:hypothetical protein